LHAIAFGQDTLHVLIGGAGMDDQRQAGFLRRLDMQAQRGFCASALSAV
jgi:hypothetical protein